MSLPMAKCVIQIAIVFKISIKHIKSKIPYKFACDLTFKTLCYHIKINSHKK